MQILVVIELTSRAIKEEHCGIKEDHIKTQ